MLITCGIYLYSLRSGKILVCHATKARWNQWSIPKGLKEPAEVNSFAVAMRELYEETGIDFRSLHVISTSTLTPVKYQKQNKTLESFLVVTDTDLDNFNFSSNSVKEGIDEVDSWKWISLSEAKDWLHESQNRNLHLIKERLETLDM